jgi:chromosomal replication initiator protein
MHAWESFVEAQEGELGKETIHKWLKTLKVTRFDACNLHLEAKDAFQAMWFEEHIRQKVQTKLLNNNNKRIKVHLSVANVPAKKSKTPYSKSKQSIELQRPAFDLVFDGLDPYCTFEHFAVSDLNLFTYKVLKQITELDRTSSPELPNPIYVHGGMGCGKTHLQMATAHALRSRGLHVIYSRAQTFTDHVVSAIRAGEMSIFRQAYRNSDVLIIDDVHVFSRKGATQEEFFHTFNTLHVAGKQIILSANCAPGELQLIEPRLVSRFEWGIVLSLEPPSREEAGKILSAKALAMDFPLHHKVVEFLLDSFSTTNALNKALEALILRAHLNRATSKGPLTVLLAKQVLSDLLVEEQQAATTPPSIIKSVAEFFGIRPEDILGNSQTRDCVLPRQISMHLCRHLLKMPYVKIGDLFSKDHSTVMSSVKLIQRGIDGDDQEIGSPYRAIMKKIKS